MQDKTFCWFKYFGSTKLCFIIYPFLSYGIIIIWENTYETTLNQYLYFKIRQFV